MSAEGLTDFDPERARALKWEIGRRINLGLIGQTGWPERVCYVRTEDGTSWPVHAWVWGHFALHLSPVSEMRKGLSCLTHLPSGYPLLWSNRADLLKTAAETLEPLCDWNGPTHRLWAADVLERLREALLPLGLDPGTNRLMPTGGR